MRAFAVATLFAGAGLVSAQSLSSGCKSTLESLVANPEASCLSPGALISLAVGGNNTSIVSPINNWLSSLCSTAVCSNQTLSDVVTNVTSGCSSDLSSIGATVNSGSVGDIISVVQQAYPTARSIACLKDTATNTNCVTETLNNIQSVVGQLTLSNVVATVTKFVSGTASSIPTNVTCTDCVKQAYNLANQAFPAEVGTLSQAAQQQCGATFTNGATPSDVQQTASNSTSNNSKSGAVTLLPMNAFAGAALAGLLVVSSAFTFFA